MIPRGADSEAMWLLRSLELHGIELDLIARTVLAHVEVCPGCELCGRADHLARARLIELARQFIDLPKENQ